MTTIRLSTSFRMIESSFPSLDDICDRLRRVLRKQQVRDMHVYPDRGRVHVDFVVDADGFNDANVKSGKLLLRALDGIGISVGNPEDIDKVSTVDELEDASEHVLLDQSRQLSYA